MPRSLQRDSYRRGFTCGSLDLDPRPPDDAGEQWEYWNGFLDATKDRGIGDYGVIDQERAEIARRGKATRHAVQAQEAQSRRERSGWAS